MPSFERELDIIMAYHSNNLPYIENFFIEFYKGLGTLLLFPRLGSIHCKISDTELRSYIVKYYKIYYSVEADYIALHHIIHTKRDEIKIIN